MIDFLSQDVNVSLIFVISHISLLFLCFLRMIILSVQVDNLRNLFKETIRNDISFINHFIDMLKDSNIEIKDKGGNNGV